MHLLLGDTVHTVFMVRCFDPLGWMWADLQG